jgi:hypothetical protein
LVDDAALFPPGNAAFVSYGSIDEPVHDFVALGLFNLASKAGR